MPSNSSGWFWHTLARETGRLGHLYGPGGQRGPWPWFPYALDNGAFACWDSKANRFDTAKWAIAEPAWQRLIFWAQTVPIKPLWAIVPDVPGDAVATFDKWKLFSRTIPEIPLALAVQDGMTIDQVRSLSPAPAVVAVGGTTEWKWETVEKWAQAFPRVHLLRCNSPTRLCDLEELGVESCDGTGWNRGDRKQTEGLERWARSKPNPTTSDLWPFVCRQPKDPTQGTFA